MGYVVPRTASLECELAQSHALLDSALGNRASYDI